MGLFAATGYRSLLAQQLFTPPSHGIEWNRYQYLEECAAAVTRSEQAARFLTAYQRDILPGRSSNQTTDTLFATTLNDADADTSPALVTAARTCLARFPISQATPDELPTLLTLAANVRDDNAVDAVIRRQWSVSPLSSGRDSAQIVVDAVTAIIHVHRSLRSLLQRYTWTVDSLWPGAVAQRITFHVFALGMATQGDILDPDSLADTMTTLVNSIAALSKSARYGALRPEDAQVVTNATFLVQMYGGEIRMLRGDFDGGVAQVLSLVQHPTPELPIGAMTPPVTGPFQFSFADTTLPRSSGGQPQIVAFVSPACERYDGNCPVFYAMLRRLHRRFPTLAITLVTYTGTHLGMRNLPTTTAGEAEQLRAYYQDELQIPATVVVDTLPHSRLPAPDNRWLITKLGEVGKMWTDAGLLNERYPTEQVYLLDQRGRVLLQSILAEPAMTAVLRRMLSQGGSRKGD